MATIMVEYQEEFWKLWKTFPALLEKLNLKEEWNLLKELTLSGGYKGHNINGRSIGVITFVIKHISDKLNLRLATEVFLEGTNKKKDYTLYQSDGTEIFHIEYENKHSQIYGEFKKLEKSKSAIKMVITYFPTSKYQKYLEGNIQPKLNEILVRNPRQNWMFILGLGKGAWLLEHDENWIAYRAANINGIIEISRIN